MIERFLPAPSDEHSDDRYYIETHLITCQQCDFTTATPVEDEEAVYRTHDAHFEETCHTRFWKYTISRSTGRIGTIRAPSTRPQKDKK